MEWQQAKRLRNPAKEAKQKKKGKKMRVLLMKGFLLWHRRNFEANETMRPYVGINEFLVVASKDMESVISGVDALCAKQLFCSDMMAQKVMHVSQCSFDSS